MTPRGGHTLNVFNNNMWLIAGETSTTKTNDIWYSSDGKSWTLVTNNAPFGKLEDHTTLVYGGRLWVIGGDGGSFNNNVWYSTDGTNWTQTAASGHFTPRKGHASVVFDNKMWVIGGLSSSDTNDVWWSTDGISWTLATNSAAFMIRNGHRAATFDNKMWVSAGAGSGGNLNDLWYSEDGANWTQAIHSGPIFSVRRDHGFTVLDNKLFVFGGQDAMGFSDFWSGTLAVTPVQSIETSSASSQTLSANGIDWSLISVHTTNGNDSVESLLPGNEGDAIYTWNPNLEEDLVFLKYDRPTNLERGKGYWLFTENPYSINFLGTFVSNDVQVSLKGGDWNLLGNPYPFQIDSSALRILSNTSEITLQASSSIDSNSLNVYANVQDVFQYVQVQGNTKINSGEGFWIYANEDSTLVFKPVPSQAVSTSPGFNPQVQDSSQWSFNLGVTADRHADLYNFVGVSPGAQDGQGKEDSLEPPHQSRYISLHFGQSGEKLAYDLKSPVDSVKIWDFEIKTDLPKKQAILQWTHTAPSESRHRHVRGGRQTDWRKNQSL